MRGMIQGKGACPGARLGLLLVIALFAFAACAGADVKSDTARGSMMTLAKNTNPCAVKNPCNPCAVKKANPCNPCAAKLNPCNPCAAKNPCNPCAAKNPCNPCGGGGKVDPKMVTRPAGMKAYLGSRAQLVAEGEKLWQDNTLSRNGLACGTCHINYGNLNKTFLKPYPHHVAMPQQRAGLKTVSGDEMVQFCMVVPMASKPLGWGSRELAALTAYTGEVQKGFVKAAAANPCLLKSAVNPCNPCAVKNPCAAKMNPCNPCAAKKANPCNPCYKKK